MAIVPSNYWRDWWEDLDRPRRLLDEHFELSVTREDLLRTVTVPVWRDYFRPWRNLLDGVKSDVGKIDCENDKFRVTIDVQPFAPHEIIVKTVGNSIIVKANHEERKSLTGQYTTREFFRRYDLPKGYDITRVMSSLSTDGVLTITAPKLPLPPLGERIIPINRVRFSSLKF